MSDPIPRVPDPAPPAPDRAEGLDAIMRPRSIAVIGASRSPDTIGHEIVANLVRYGFTGAVYPVNPKAAAIHSIKAYPAVGDIPDPVDLAVIAVPKELVLQVAEECGQAGRQGAGRDLARDSARWAARASSGSASWWRSSAATACGWSGPNCMGVLNADPAVSMNATFAPSMPPFGRRRVRLPVGRAWG